MASKTIRVEYIARVEGEGALDLHIDAGRVTSAQLNIFEPPRFFEAFLRGRGYAETPDIVARILRHLPDCLPDECCPCDRECVRHHG